MEKLNFIRVGAIVNQLYLASPKENAKELIKMIRKAEKEQVSIVVTPELSLTGYTCGDLFGHKHLLNLAKEALKMVIDETKDLDIISILGLPLSYENELFNCAVVIQKGKILGVVPKSYIPNYGEFYEKRWFSSGLNLKNKKIQLLGEEVFMNTNLIFKDKKEETLAFAIEICEDLWTVIPPNYYHAINGATLLFNLSSSNEIVGKASYRKNLIKDTSSRTMSAYIYASSGIMESTQDLLFGGASMIYENGKMLAENQKYDLKSNLIYADIDLDHLSHDRRKNTSYNSDINDREYQEIRIDVKRKMKTIKREYKKYPFIPQNEEERKKRCEEIIEIQTNALVRRLIHLNNPKCIIGISGGLDSTLAFLITIKAFQKLKRDPKDIIAITMKGFGTTNRTYKNACELTNKYQVTLKEISIKEACLLHMKDIGLDKKDRSITYENIQARERTQILMSFANLENGIVIGTGDLSELALGWCTYNGDHMSMYNVNSSIPKTLVRDLVKTLAEKEEEEKRKIMFDILNTPISPELLPPDKNGEMQKTETEIGPYILHDFYLYYFLRYQDAPLKIYELAKIAFQDDYKEEEIKKYLNIFMKRFIREQFKRSCMPDGVKVGSISLSPRGDLRLPSDMKGTIFTLEEEEIK